MIGKSDVNRDGGIEGGQEGWNGRGIVRRKEGRYKGKKENAR